MKRIPTKIGDVLILMTRLTFTAYSIGVVSKDHQQDFEADQSNISHVADMRSAVAVARSRLVAGRRIFLRNMDTGDWSAIPG